MRLLEEGVGADRRRIYAILLNSYLESLSGQTPGEKPEPFFGRDIEVLLHQDQLVIVCKHFRLDFPATAAGMVEARRAIDDLALLALRAPEGLGDALEMDPERGYYAERNGEREYFPDTEEHEGDRDDG